MWFWRAIVAGVLVGAVWVFYRPIVKFIDRLRLPVVRVLQVVETHPAAFGAVSGTAANGYIVAARRAALSADTPGRIVEMNVTEGSILEEGDVVARLYFKEYEAAHARAEADLEVAKAEVTRAEAAERAAESELLRRQRGENVAKAEVDDEESQRKLAQARFERQTNLFAKGIASQDDVDVAKAGIDSAKARVASAKARRKAAAAEVEDARHLKAVATADLRVAGARQAVAASAAKQAAATLDKTFIRAPFDGIVVMKDAEVGEVVSPNSQGGSNARGSVCTMVDFDSLEVQADVQETNLASVRVGATANIYLDAYPERTYKGRVSRIWPTANRQKGSIEVRIVFLQRDKDLRPDMGVRIVFLDSAAVAAVAAVAGGAGGDAGKASVARSGEKQILVPVEAVVEFDGKRGAFVLERDFVRFQVLEVGYSRAGRIAVYKGLRPGQRVVLDPPADLQTGSRVQEATGH